LLLYLHAVAFLLLQCRLLLCQLVSGLRECLLTMMLLRERLRQIGFKGLHITDG